MPDDNQLVAGSRRAAMVILVALDGRLLLHHRDDKPGVLHPGCWAGFGGAVELGESVEAAAKREVLEETGLAIASPTFLCDLEDKEGRGDMVSLFFVRGPFDPEDVMLSEGQKVGLFHIKDLDTLRVTPFVWRAITMHLIPRLSGRDDQPVPSS